MHVFYVALKTISEVIAGKASESMSDVCTLEMCVLGTVAELGSQCARCECQDTDKYAYDALLECEQSRSRWFRRLSVSHEMSVSA